MQMPNAQPASAPAQLDLSYRIDFASLAGWEDDDHAQAFDAFCRSARQIIRGTYPIHQGQIDRNALIEVAQTAVDIGQVSSSEARGFFEECFDPYVLGTDESFEGFLTGYFEPELPASRLPSDVYSVPLYRPPADLADSSNEAGLYKFDRADLQAGALSGQGLELAWLTNKTDAYFLHVQGSARLRLDDGETMRVSFAAKTGHDYTSLGKALSDKLNIPQHQMTADRLADWMNSNPDQLDAFTAQNRSFIFFKELLGLDNEEGPIGAAGVSLVPGRSLAVDQAFHSYGVPIWLSVRDKVFDHREQKGRLMIAHDTGSAIKGPQRGDIFVGSGKQAGIIAGRIQSPARMDVLVPKS